MFYIFIKKTESTQTKNQVSDKALSATMSNDGLSILRRIPNSLREIVLEYAPDHRDKYKKCMVDILLFGQAVTIVQAFAINIAGVVDYAYFEQHHVTVAEAREVLSERAVCRKCPYILDFRAEYQDRVSCESCYWEAEYKEYKRQRR